MYLYPLRIVDEAGEDDDAEDEEEDQQHQLLGGGSECLQEDLEPAGVPGEFEQPEDPDDAEELEHVRVLDVGDEMLEDEVGVEADGGHKVNNIDGGLEEITFVWTTEEPGVKHLSEDTDIDINQELSHLTHISMVNQALQMYSI